MNHPAWLIAEREFRTYAATASFWVALAIAPLLMGGGLLLSANTQKPARASASLTLTPNAKGALEARFSEAFPLSDAGRAEVLRAIERDARVPVTLRANPDPKPFDAAALSRFAMVMLLWVTLVGSLGMLLQAVVRERANRALESLLAAARPLDIALGKLAGVGAVSLVVLSVWMGSAAVMGLAAGASAGPMGVLLQGLADPLALARAGLIYVLGFAFYGLTTVAVGAMARDNADAQNLARPMFAVLLVAFFTVLSSVSGGGEGLAWLAFLPPFTPFVLLMSPPSGPAEAAALALLALATVAAGAFAVRVMQVERVNPVPKWLRRRAARA